MLCLYCDDPTQQLASIDSLCQRPDIWSCREEQVAYDALKKQMVFYQHTLSAAGLRQQRDSFAAKDPQASARAQRADPLGGLLSPWRESSVLHK